MIAYREPFSRWVAASTILHGALIGAFVFGGSLFSSKAETFGTPGGSGGIHVKMVNGTLGIPLPPRPAINPGAPPSDTPGWTKPPEKTEAPAKTKAPAKEAASPKAPPSNKGIEIPVAGAKPPKPAPKKDPGPATSGATTAARSTSLVTPPTQVATNTPPPGAFFGGNGGTAQVTYGKTGAGTTALEFSEGAFGSRFGWYADRVSAAVSQYWQGSAGTQTAPKISIVFTINRDGSVTDLDFERKSNVDALDTAAKRAVTLAAIAKQIPPLPSEYRGSSVKARLSFEYSR
ncbi:MAG TPA: TonB C-terminal domain-containing protein [Terriglobia bacterium]|nr:TonB C-terminal domain-containing protein [Terriglobia bacterium]